MAITATDSLHRFRAPAYLILVLSALFPIVDLLLTVAPWHPSVVMWRFGAVGMAANAVAGPLLILLLVYGVALLFADRRILMAIGIVSLLGAVLLTLAFGAFALDALQMKAQVRPEALRKFTFASGQAFVKLLIQAISATVLGLSAIRASRAKKQEMARSERPSPGAMLVGSPARGKAAAPQERVESPVAGA